MKTSWWRSRQTSWRLLAGLVVSFGLSLGVSAQTAAPAAAAPAAATKAAAPEAAPALPAGSTAQPGWNVPPKWSDVELKPQYASVPGREMNVLLEDKGQWWREIRNGPVTFYGGILMLVVPALLLAFFAVKGPFKLHSALSGRLIERFN